MKITFIGATHEVTGSCYYLEAAGRKFLVDYGMEQGPDYYENKELPVAPGDLDFVLLTHAHMIIPEIFRPCMQKAIRGRSMRQRQLVISAISCFVTAHISRCSRLSGETDRGGEKENRNLFLHTRWKMPWVCSGTSSDAHMIRSSNRQRESK